MGFKDVRTLMLSLFADNVSDGSRSHLGVSMEWILWSWPPDGATGAVQYVAEGFHGSAHELQR